MTRIIFVQVPNIAVKLQRIVETARSHFIKKERFLFFVEDEKALHYMDELLWKLPETGFLPHRTCNQPTTEWLAITKTKLNVNEARCAFNLCPTPLFIEGLKIIYELEDLTTPTKKHLSEMRFNAYKQANMLCTSSE